MDILLIEDNPADVLLTKVALEEINYEGKLSVISDGATAIKHIKSFHKKNPSFYPSVILVDINLPRKNGFEVLQFIKGHSKTKHIPTYILSTSQSRVDMDLAHSYLVDRYLVKPLEFDKYIQLLHGIVSQFESGSKMINAA